MPPRNAEMPKKTSGNLSERPKRPTFLQEWREYAGFSVREAANEIGIDRSMLSKLERNKTAQGYNQVFLEAAAKAYGCEPADLISRAPPKSRLAK